MFEIAGVDEKIQSFTFGKLTVFTVNFLPKMADL